MGCRPMAMVIMQVHKCEKLSNKFKSGELHEKHAVAAWKLGNQENLCRRRRSQDLPDTDF